MFDAGVSRLMHRHGDEWFEMSPHRDDPTLNPDSNDMERDMDRGEQVMRCSACDVEIRMAPGGDEP
jgi:hypothetical protein